MAATPAGPYDRYEEEAKGFRLGPPPAPPEAGEPDKAPGPPPDRPDRPGKDGR